MKAGMHLNICASVCVADVTNTEDRLDQLLGYSVESADGDESVAHEVETYLREKPIPGKSD